MDAFWQTVLGPADVWARPAVGIALFTLALYFLARPRKHEVLSAEEQRKQRGFTWVLVGIVVIFTILLYSFFTLTSTML